MAANVENNVLHRVAPWHGLGVRVESALSSQGSTGSIRTFDWNVIQRPIIDRRRMNQSPATRANGQGQDNKVLAWSVTATGLSRMRSIRRLRMPS